MHSIKYSLRGLFLFVTVIAIMIFAVGLALKLWPIDGMSGVIGHLLSNEDTTVYVPGYSERAFRLIRKGMTQAEAYRLLGPPFSEVADATAGSIRAGWTYSSSDSDFRRREIIFQNGAVFETIAEYWID